MKKLILAALAASAIATPALAAPYNHYEYGRGTQQVRVIDQRNGHGVYTNGYNRNGTIANVRNWQRGQRFDRRYARNYHEIRDPRAYRLRQAPRGYHWVRSGNDAVMVSLISGLIAAVAANSF